VSSCAWSEDGAYVATAQYDGLVRVWRRPAPAPRMLTVAWGGRPRVSLDGRLVAPGRLHQLANEVNLIARQLVVLDATTGRPAGPPIPLTGQLVDSAVGADGRSVVAVSHDGATAWWGVWDVATARPRFAARRLPAIPQSLAVRPQASQIAVLSADGAV